MLAVVLEGGKVRIEADHSPPRNEPGSARVQTRLAGVCDTDLQLARGYMGFAGVPGHEFVGRVLEAASPEWKGERVVADINAGCGRCPDCVERNGHHCTTRTVLGILGRSGAFAEQLTIPERCLVKVPDSVSDEHAVFAEPLAAALHVLDALPKTSAGSIGVVGDGKLGLLIALGLAGAGQEVTLVGHHRQKLDLAGSRSVRTCLESELHDQQFEVVVEASGSSTGLKRAIALTQPRGTLVLKTTVSGEHRVDLAPVVVNELTVVGSRCGDLAQAIAALADGRIDPTPLIEARYPLTRADEAFAHAARPGALKVLIEGVDHE